MSHREKDDGYDRIIAQLGPTHRLIECKDPIQWILQEHNGYEWRSKKFFTSGDGARRRTQGLPGAALLANLPERFSAGFCVTQEG